MTVYYKATDTDGLSFVSGTTGRIDYAAALVSGVVIRHPAPKKVRVDAGTYISVSVEPADCTGFRWPCRLFRVEPVGRVSKATAYPNKRCVSALRVVEELPAWMALGPNGQEVAALIERCRSLTGDEIRRLHAARGAASWGAAWDAARGAASWGAAWDAARGAASWGAAWDAARDAARDASWGAAWDAARGAAWGASWGAAWDAARDASWDAARDASWGASFALLVRDLISPEHFATLTGPWVSVMGTTWETA